MAYKCSINATVHRNVGENINITSEDGINIAQCVEGGPDISGNTAYTVRGLISLINDTYGINIISISYEDGGEPLDGDECVWQAGEGSSLCEGGDIYVISEEPQAPTVARVMMGPGGMIKSIVTPETYTDYSAMRGPCPEGFHIPSYEERTSTKAILDAMGAPANSSTFKVPPTGSYYYGYGTEKSRINATGQIRCCNVYSNDNGAMIYNMNAIYATPKNALMPIRAFKDDPVIPDGSRSVIYDGSSTATGAGIFWSESLGLFSISSDGINWKTLADKNVGATQAGTSKNAACVGYLFQWGNNHGFTYANNPTFPSTTSTQVDTTGYGPGNYYSSNVYYDKGSDGDWSAPSNNNLWGYQTGAIQLHIKTNGVYIITPQ